jgi:hypothetical protein
MPLFLMNIPPKKVLSTLNEFIYYNEEEEEEKPFQTVG